MNLAVLLREANIPPNVIETLLGFGLTTPEVLYTFLVNNPRITSPEVAQQLGLKEWAELEAFAPKQNNNLISLLEANRTLAPNYLNMKNRQLARLNDAPLGALLESDVVAVGDDKPPREAMAADYVAVVEENAKMQPALDRTLPVGGFDLRLRPGPTIPWPVRDQRPSPSCTAFAVAAAVELHSARQGPIPAPGQPHPAPARLSARFLYREARRAVLGDAVKAAKPAYKGGGLKQEDVAAVLNAQGVPVEALYRDKFEPADVATTIAEFNLLKEKQTPKAKADALPRKHSLQIQDFPDYRKRPPGMARKVFEYLQNGNPVVVSIPGFSEPKDPNVKGSGESIIWHDEHFWDTGVLPLPPPHYIVGKPGHVVCVIGYLQVPSLTPIKFPQYTHFPGYFLFRNSWGAQYFARNSPIMEPAYNLDFDFPRGYGLIPATLMEYFVWEYGVIQ